MFNIDKGSIHNVEENEILQLPDCLTAIPPLCFCIVICNESGECEDVGGINEGQTYYCYLCKQADFFC